MFHLFQDLPSMVLYGSETEDSEIFSLNFDCDVLSLGEEAIHAVLLQQDQSEMSPTNAPQGLQDAVVCPESEQILEYFPCITPSSNPRAEHLQFSPPKPALPPDQLSICNPALVTCPGTLSGGNAFLQSSLATEPAKQENTDEVHMAACYAKQPLAEAVSSSNDWTSSHVKHSPSTQRRTCFLPPSPVTPSAANMPWFPTSNYATYTMARARFPSPPLNSDDNQRSQYMSFQVRNVSQTSCNSSTSSQKKPTEHQCTVCDKDFTRRYNLISHMRTHSKEKPYPCKFPGCNKRFARQHDVRRHALLHTGEKPHPCKFCDQRFVRRDALKRHWERDRRCRILAERNPSVVYIRPRRNMLRQ